MRHFFETIFYYCYLSYKKHDGGSEHELRFTLYHKPNTQDNRLYRK